MAGALAQTTTTPLSRTRPWQQGTNENANGLSAEHFPKGTDLCRWSAEDIVNTPVSAPVVPPSPARYTAGAVGKACADAGLRRSMGITEICWANSDGAQNLCGGSALLLLLLLQQAGLRYAGGSHRGIGRQYLYDNRTCHSVVGVLSPVRDTTQRAATQAATPMEDLNLVVLQLQRAFSSACRG